MKIPLFDIDGTLLQGGSGNTAHRGGFDYAFQKVYELEHASIDEIKTDGMIDKQIILEVLKLHGVTGEEAISKLDLAVDAIVEYFHQHEGEITCVAASGAEDLLKLLKEKGVHIGLLTGNIEEIGWRKLELAGIKEYFDFGSFGNLALKRVDLIEIARERANTKLGTTYQTSDLMIIGDSPLDVLCAQQGGIPVIGVGAANFTVDDLRKAGADLVVSTLEEHSAILDFLNQ